MSVNATKSNLYKSLVGELVVRILESTGTGGIGGFESSMGMMRHQEKPPPGRDLTLEPAKFKTIPSIHKNLVPTRSVVSKENFNYNKGRGERLVKDQYAKTAEWLQAIMQGQANAQKEELKMQKAVFGQTTAEHEHELDFQKQKLAIDGKRMALKAKYAVDKPKAKK